MEPKKISFGFSKINKKPIIIVSNKIAQKTETIKVELIKCLEGQEIKLVEEKPKEVELVIPLKENQKTSAALASLMKRRAVLLGEDEPSETITPTDIGEKVDAIINETDDIDKRAAQELLAEINANSAEKINSDLVLPVVHPDDLPLEGAKESSLDDYDDIPVEQFGKAMLRGMGWIEPQKPAKGAPPLDDSPMVRPKGMGLGADKALKAKPLLVAPESNEVLQVKRNAFVRILGGKHKDMYGQIEGFDDHAGRVIVKMAIGGFKEAFNEFLCQPVSKKEYAQYGKCINSSKYEEYKRRENEHGQIILEKDEIAEIDKRSIKYGKIKRETQVLSSDEDCKTVERKQLSAEANAGSREQKNCHDRNIKDERSYKKEYKREDERRRDEKRPTKRENTTDYDRDRKTGGYNKDDKNRDGPRHKEEDNRESNTDYQKDSYRRNRNKDSEGNGERSRDRYESDYSNKYVERRRDSNQDYLRDQRSDYHHKDYDGRKSRQIQDSNLNESHNDDRIRYNKSSKDKKTKKKSKSKKSKSKYQETSDSESTTSSSSSTSDSEEDRRKKHKKKTKKSKKERERSRSRGRR